MKVTIRISGAPRGLVLDVIDSCLKPFGLHQKRHGNISGEQRIELDLTPGDIEAMQDFIVMRNHLRGN